VVFARDAHIAPQRDRKLCLAPTKDLLHLWEAPGLHRRSGIFKNSRAMGCVDENQKQPRLHENVCNFLA